MFLFWAYSSSTIVLDKNVRTLPEHLTHKPTIALSLQGSPYHGAQGHYSGTLGFDYQPKFIQPFGVLSLGGIIRGFRTPQANRFIPWSTGLHLTYQFNFSINQILVPFVGYTTEFKWTTPETGAQLRKFYHGPQAGIALLLNALDRLTSSQFYYQYGIARTYLTTAFHWFNIGQDQSFVITLGLRFEG